MKLPDTPKQGVDNSKNQRRLTHNEPTATQGPDGYDIEVGRHRQFAQKRAVALHGDHAHRYFGAAANEIEQTDTEVACKALVDDFHRRHAPAHDALLARNVVASDLPGLKDFLLSLLTLAGNAFEQGVDFFLRQERFAHGRLPGSLLNDEPRK